MSKSKELKIVPVNEIPKGESIDISKDLFKIYSICLELQRLCDKEDGIGISAVQAGLPLNLFLSRESGSYRYYLNCDFTPANEQKLIMQEGCLSLRNAEGQLRRFQVSRFLSVYLNGFELVKTPNDLKIVEIKNEIHSNLAAVVFQHEIHHGQGILISDIGEELDVTPIT